MESLLASQGASKKRTNHHNTYTGDTLRLYVSTSPKMVAATLFVGKGKQQQPIYFISHILNGLESHYQLVEKMALAVLIVARKLGPYFN